MLKNNKIVTIGFDEGYKNQGLLLCEMYLIHVSLNLQTIRILNFEE
ncbi:protein of unknown function [Candidatus Nitrosocosmicus franklandus]|uniref:Uncharacterized protein n=1 Tax=Candidatus Nitrosocosmicus franklandianus TaxID=1798806 RepID=A0A484IIT6_9ARCH|nr:protein of unknown function [Candidatus Nitrosocosmicus franklandus]